MNRSALPVYWFLCIMLLAGSVSDLKGQDTLSLSFTCQTVEVGQTTCITISTSDIPALSSAQFTFHFDPNSFNFVEIRNIHPEFQVDPLTFSPVNDQGYFVVAWISQSQNIISFPDGSVLFEVCLEATGPPDMSLVNVFDFPAAIEFGNDGEALPFHPPQGCMIDVVPATDLNFYATNCYSQASGTGTINFEVYGGTGPYVVDYLGPVSATVNVPSAGQQNTISGIPAGDYVFAISDAVGNMLINQIVTISDTDSDILIAIDPEPPICPGDDSTGFITLLPIVGGTAPYTIEWSTGELGALEVFDLPDGNHSVTVTDSKGCSTIESVTFSTPPFIIDSIQGPTFECGPNNRLRIKATGGTDPNQDFFDYVWVNPSGDTIEQLGFGTSSPGDNLDAGIYAVTVTDELDCSAEFSIQVGKEIQIDILQLDSISCNGGSNGFIRPEANVVQGNLVGNLVLELFRPDGSSIVAAQFSNLGPGTYTLVATDDGDGCSGSRQFSLNDPAPFDTAFVNIINKSCNSTVDDGRIQIAMMGGTRPYSFAWSNGDTDSVTTTGLGVGNYTVTITDGNGCPQNYSFDITEASVSFGLDTIQSITCPNTSDGQLGLTGLQQGYEIAWSTGQNTAIISNLSPGIYTVTVTDPALMCSGVQSVELLAPEGISIGAVAITPPSCFGGSDGILDITVIGGTEPYLYNWNDGSTFRTLSLITSGDYSLTVTDANNCESLSFDTTVTDPQGMILTFTNIDSVSCFTPGIFGPDGGADVLVTNGAPPYFYVWENGEMGPNATMSNQLTAGWNSISVSDADNCVMTDSVFVPSPDPITLDTIQTIINNPTCFGDSNGSITAQAQGGKPSYVYLWPDTSGGPGVIGPTVNGLTAGTYLLLVRDVNSCRDSLTVTVTEPPELIATIDSSNTSAESCHDSNDGVITLSVQGGNDGTYNYNWSPDISSGNQATNLDTGLYMITITDQLNCRDTVTYDLLGPSPIVYTFGGNTQATCFGEQVLLDFNGISGGNEPTDYNISFNGGPSQSNNNPISVAAGQYTLNITDKLGCSIDTSILITEPPEIIIDFGNIGPIDLGDSIPVEVLVTGGNNVFVDYAWDNLTNLNCFDPNCLSFIASPVNTTQYQLTVTDSSGCMADAILLIEVLLRRNVFIPNAFSPNGDGVNDIFRLFTGPGVSNINYLRVFDRWGDLVHQTLNITPSFGGTEGWNGEYKNLVLNPAVYVYAAEVEFIDGTKLIYRGDVALIR